MPNVWRLSRRSLLLQAAIASASLPLWAKSAPARWVASWAAAPQPYFPFGATPDPAERISPAPLVPQTLRQQLPAGLDGQRLRLRFSNLFGAAPLHLAAASVARSAGGSDATAIAPDTLQVLRFGGRSDVWIPPGQERWSDPAPLATRAGETLAVSFYVDRPTPPGTVHHLPLGASASVAGNAVQRPRFKDAQQPPWNYIVTGLEVARSAPAQVLVAFGDSITEGTDPFQRVHRPYPARLAERLRERPGQMRATAVLNAGIAGNRLLSEGGGPRGVDRFVRDVLAQRGVTHAIVLIGINDIGVSVLDGPVGHSQSPPGAPVTAPLLIAGLQRLIGAARDRGVKLLLGTLPPTGGSGYGSPEKEALRQQLNRWIRARRAPEVLAVVDFDAALRDPAQPEALAPRYDSGDHLHPNQAGYDAMAAAVDLRLFLPRL